jgi:hypothetical protein
VVSETRRAVPSTACFNLINFQVSYQEKSGYSSLLLLLDYCWVRLYYAILMEEDYSISFISSQSPPLQGWSPKCDLLLLPSHRPSGGIPIPTQFGVIIPPPIYAYFFQTYLYEYLTSWHLQGNHYRIRKPMPIIR